MAFHGKKQDCCSSVTDYVDREMYRRNTRLFVINTSSSQEQAMIHYLKGMQGIPLERWPGNCAERTSGALAAGGLPYPSFFGRTPSWPRHVVEQGQFWQRILGGETIELPKIDSEKINTIQLPSLLQQFNQP